VKFCLITAVFPPHTVGGYELGCRDIARALVARGHDVHVLTSASVGRLRKGASAADLQVHEIFDPVFGHEAELVAQLTDSTTWVHEWTESFSGVHYGNALALGRWLEAHRPDVVWLFSTIGLGPVGIYEAALSTNARVLALLMDDIDGYVLGSRRNLSWRPRFKRLKSRIDAISCSELTRTVNRKIGDYRRHTVIYNGAPFPTSRPEPARGGSVFSFCYHGQIAEHKGLLHVVRAAVDLRQQRPDLAFEIHLYGAGTRSFEHRLVDEIRDAGLTRQFTLHGFVEKDELMHRLRHHDAALHLLRDGEPFAYAPIEAAVQGLPLILSRTGGNGECVRTDYPLLVEDRGDVGAVARLMAWCIEHRDQLPALATHIYDDFQAGCDFGRVTLPGYFEAIEQTPPNACPTSIASLLASCRSVDLYAQSRLPFERLRAAALSEVPPVAWTPATPASQTALLKPAAILPRHLHYLLEEADVTQLWTLPLDRALRRVLAQAVADQQAVWACELPEASSRAPVVVVKSGSMDLLERLLDRIEATRPHATIHVLCHAKDVAAVKALRPAADVRPVVYPRFGPYDAAILEETIREHVPEDVRTAFYLDNSPMGRGADLEHVAAGLLARGFDRVYLFNRSDGLHDQRIVGWPDELMTAVPVFLRWWGALLADHHSKKTTTENARTPTSA
jgi:glycogen synthase